MNLDNRILVTGGSGFIGTHLVDSLLVKGIELINLDIAAPKKEAHNAYWRECNILDLDRLRKIFLEFGPSHVIHLAAKTTMGGETLEDFRDNTVGTANVLEATRLTSSASRLIVTSSQHVRKPGSGLPQHDADYVPHGLYGESKVITEKLTREADLACVWTIIRPTTVWGPLHPLLPKGLWRIMEKGWYLHPKNDPVVRGYGYVENVVWQMEKILQAPKSLVDRKTYYLGEEPMKQIDWINAFTRALTRRDVRTVPKYFIHLLALLGDTFDTLGISFPMNSPRFFNLTTDNPVPLAPTLKAFGTPPFSLGRGIETTVRWLQSQENEE
jgi:nucleoside-diphosphate-sugar epimerase